MKFGLVSSFMAPEKVWVCFSFKTSYFIPSNYQQNTSVVGESFPVELPRWICWWINECMMHDFCSTDSTMGNDHHFNRLLFGEYFWFFSQALSKAWNMKDDVSDDSWESVMFSWQTSRVLFFGSEKKHPVNFQGCTSQLFSFGELRW